MAAAAESWRGHTAIAGANKLKMRCRARAHSNWGLPLRRARTIPHRFDPTLSNRRQLNVRKTNGHDLARSITASVAIAVATD